MEEEMKKVLLFTALSLIFSPSLFAKPIHCPLPEVVQEAFKKVLTPEIAKEVALEATKDSDKTVKLSGFYQMPPLKLHQTGKEHAAQCFYFTKKQGKENYFYHFYINN